MMRDDEAADRPPVILGAMAPKLSYNGTFLIRLGMGIRSVVVSKGNKVIIPGRRKN